MSNRCLWMFTKKKKNEKEEKKKSFKNRWRKKVAHLLLTQRRALVFFTWLNKSLLREQYGKNSINSYIVALSTFVVVLSLSLLFFLAMSCFSPPSPLLLFSVGVKVTPDNEEQWGIQRRETVLNFCYEFEFKFVVSVLLLISSREKCNKWTAVKIFWQSSFQFARFNSPGL